MCKTPVDHPNDRWVISEDALRADGTKRFYRVRMTSLCTMHMKERQEKWRHVTDENQQGLF